MKGKNSFTCLLVLFLLSITLPAHAATIGWTNWTSEGYGLPGFAYGSIDLPGGGTVTVSYTGENIQTGDPGNWSQYPSTYTDPGVVDNVPAPSNESIQLIGGNRLVDTITFSVPVVDPVLAIQSLGSGWDLATYSFSEPFTLLAQGPGHWGGSNGSLTQNGELLSGYEGNGIIQFDGTFSSISWTVPDGENYHMFTIGAPSAASPTPEPATMFLMLAGIVGFIGVKIRKKKQA